MCLSGDGEEEEAAQPGASSLAIPHAPLCCVANARWPKSLTDVDLARATLLLHSSSPFSSANRKSDGGQPPTHQYLINTCGKRRVGARPRGIQS